MAPQPSCRLLIFVSWTCSLGTSSLRHWVRNLVSTLGKREEEVVLSGLLWPGFADFSGTYQPQLSLLTTELLSLQWLLVILLCYSVLTYGIKHWKRIQRDPFKKVPLTIRLCTVSLTCGSSYFFLFVSWNNDSSYKIHTRKNLCLLLQCMQRSALTALHAMCHFWFVFHFVICALVVLSPDFGAIDFLPSWAWSCWLELEDKAESNPPSSS